MSSRQVIRQSGPRGRATCWAIARSGADRERGQILVLFALGLVVMIGMVGLVLDGGGAFAQRRSEQNAADLAALAGANAYLNTNGTVAARTAAAQAAAISSATSNGYTDGVSGAVVPTPVVRLMQSGATVTVNITATHVNSFARVLGAISWDVSVTASAVSGTADTGVGAGPWTMSIDAFHANGKPKYTKDNPTAFGETNGDYPVSAIDLSWTDYNGANNVNSNEVSSIVDGTNVITATFRYGEYLGQHNSGNHATLFAAVDSKLRDEIVPIPIVGSAGRTGYDLLQSHHVYEWLLQGLGPVPRPQRPAGRQDDHGLLRGKLRGLPAQRRRVPPEPDKPVRAAGRRQPLRPPPRPVDELAPHDRHPPFARTRPYACLSQDFRPVRIGTSAQGLWTG